MYPECYSLHLSGKMCPLVQQKHEDLGVINCFLIGSEACSTGGNSCQLVNLGQPNITAALLSGHFVKLPSKYFCLCSYISAARSFDRNAFYAVGNSLLYRDS